MIFIADLIACSTCFGHHYAHHQELESIIQVIAACGVWCFGFQVVSIVWSWHITLSPTPYRQLENQSTNTTGSSHLYNTLELLMMGIMLPETCWASNKICNKNHLLHLVGILFPHIFCHLFLPNITLLCNCVIDYTKKNFASEIKPQCPFQWHTLFLYTTNTDVYSCSWE